jgi:NAD(P)-dependent dehydrogenase (short-subunit alcohol dehydrogenase family)
MTRELEGATALVTGAASGIGRGIALELAAAGASVIGFDLDAEGLARLQEELQSAGTLSRVEVVDVAQAGQLESVVPAAVEPFSGLDILVNAAGVTVNLSVADITEAAWDAAVDVNLKAAFFMSRAALPAFRARGAGVIVNIGSTSAHVVRPLMSTYAASKGGLLAMTRAMAIELAADRIRVNTVTPGPIDTPLLRRAWESMEPLADGIDRGDQLSALLPARRLGAPEDVAAVVRFLVGPRAGFVTGAEWRVDGGLSAVAGIPPPNIGWRGRVEDVPPRR